VQQEMSARLVLANNAYAAGDAALAETLARESLATAQANQMESLTIRGFINLGASHQGKGDFLGAERYFHDALSLALRTNSSRLAAQSHLNLASAYDRLHRSEDQIREAKDALAYYQPNHWVQQTLQGLAAIGRGERNRGNYTAALDSFQRLLDESTKARDRANIAIAQEGLGDALAATQDYPKALEHYREFLAVATDARSTGYAARDCAITLARMGRYSEALPEFAKAEAASAAVPLLRPSIALHRAEMALSRNQFRDAINGARAALVATANLSPLTSVSLARILGLAQIQSGDRKAGREKCQEAFAAALKLNDPGELLDARLALMEALLVARDSAQALNVFHDLEPTLAAHPESRWRAFALMARSDRQYADRAKEAIGQLDTLWGHDAFLQYLKRPDLRELSRPLLQANSAKH
jgi:tetratricopeptide (TPR) repeat protein